MLEVGNIVGDRYQLERKLGRNLGRQTWLAQDLQSENQKRVIVKFLAFGGDVEWEDLKLFEREAQILKQLDRSCIPKYIDYFSLDDRTLWFALVQEYIPGLSFKQLLDNGKRFTESEVKNIAREILQILIYLHGLNPPLLHRDIKPSNLIWGEDEKVYLVDFGAVQDCAAIEGSTFTVVGTYGYAPMEQFGGRTVPASDLYAVGATLIHLLTRTPPADLPNRDLKIQFRERVHLSYKLADWLERMTVPAVEKRFSSATQALESLDSDLNDMEQINYKNKSNSSVSRANKEPIKPFDTEIKLYRSVKFLEIVIPMRGEYLIEEILQQKSPNSIIKMGWLVVLCGSIPLILLFKILPFVGVALASLGLFLMPLSLVGVYAFLKFFFSSTKLLINQQKFEIDNQFLWYHKRQKGDTESIQDVSVNYVFNSKNQEQLNTSSIVINTRKSRFYYQFKRYLFGQGLTEAELIWLANEIRDWLASRPKI